MVCYLESFGKHILGESFTALDPFRGKAAFEFAKGKPLELLDGANLLHLLGEHAGIDARIVMPEGWIDQPVHGE